MKQPHWPMSKSWNAGVSHKTLNAVAGKLRKNSGNDLDSFESLSSALNIGAESANISKEAEHPFTCECLPCEEQRSRCELQDKHKRARPDFFEPTLPTLYEP